MSGVSLRANETLEATLDKYGGMILRLAYACLKSRDDAEDVLQDVMVKLLELHPKFESGEHEKAWLIRVTINLCRNRLRSPWRRLGALDDSVPADGSHGWDAALGERSAVLEAVMSLPEKYREVIHLFYYEDYSVAQIGRVLKKNESTVRSNLYRARKMLSERLKEGWELD